MEDVNTLTPVQLAVDTVPLQDTRRTFVRTISFRRHHAQHLQTS